MTWSPDSTTIAFTLRSAGGDADPPRHPLELWVADMASGQARTYPDLLQGPHDEQLFDHYCHSQLVTVAVATGEVKVIGPTRLYTATSASPDGRYLLVSWLERPYSYSLPCGRFPKRVQLWTRCVARHAVPCRVVT